MSDERHAQAVRRLQARYLERACSAPEAGAVPLVLDGQTCGGVDPLVAVGIANSVPGFFLRDGALQLDDATLDLEGRSRHMDEAARWLLQVGYVSPWRNEELDVRAGTPGAVLARIDRSAVRMLGITTHSVRLNGHTADGRMVVARRAAHKRIDPGMWDNLAGGIMSAGESLRSALNRETWEEAGLGIAGLALQEGARISVQRRLGDGVLREIVHVFDIDLAAQAQPSNRDGEVECFETRDVGAVLEAIERGEFTVEAALATLDSLARRAAA